MSLDELACYRKEKTISLVDCLPISFSEYARSRHKRLEDFQPVGVFGPYDSLMVPNGTVDVVECNTIIFNNILYVHAAALIERTTISFEYEKLCKK